MGAPACGAGLQVEGLRGCLPRGLHADHHALPLCQRGLRLLHQFRHLEGTEAGWQERSEGRLPSAPAPPSPPLPLSPRTPIRAL